MVSEKSVKKDWEKIWEKSLSDTEENEQIPYNLEQSKNLIGRISSYIQKLEKTWNFNKFRDSHISKDIAYLTKNENLKILDQGCGDGRIAINHLPDKSDKILMDISKGAVKLANENLLKKPECRNARIVTASVLDLPFKKCTFDLLINLGVIQYFNKTDQARISNEICRVLKKNGKAFIAVPNSKAYIFRFGMSYAKKTGQWEMGDEKTFKSIKDVIESVNGLSLEKEYSGGILIQLYHLIYFFNMKKILRNFPKKIYLMFAILANKILWPINFINFCGFYLFGIIRKE